VTLTSIREYAAAVRSRYLQGSSGENRHILDEFCQVTGYHLKSAIRLPCHTPTRVAERPGRPKK